MNKPLIVTFVGIPGSGKTTFARQLAKELKAVSLNSDGIRVSMWQTLDAIHATHSDPEERKHGNMLTFGAMNYAAERIVHAGYSVVYDCNANRVSERAEKHEIARKYGALSVVVRIKVSYEESLIRIQNREIAPDQRRITTERADEVLHRFMYEIEEPTFEENVIRIDGAIPFSQQYSQFERRLKDIMNESDNES